MIHTTLVLLDYRYRIGEPPLAPPTPAALKMTTWRRCLSLSDPQQRKYLATGILLEAPIKANATLGSELAYELSAFISLLGGSRRVNGIHVLPLRLH